MPMTAVQDLFHRFVENHGLPTWDDFRNFLLEQPQRQLLLDPWWNTLRPLLGDFGEDRVRKALTWRIGKMYLSAMREIDMLARMQHCYDICLKYHIFADVRLHTDFWIHDFNISVFLSNPTYRGLGKSSKHKAEIKLADAQPPFTFEEIEFENLRDFGKLYQVSNEELKRIASILRADGAA